MPAKSLSTIHDLSRDEIVARYRDRILKGKRNKLASDELAQLILHFIDRLALLETEADIQAACEAEIALLEEGYPQKSVGSFYVPRYRELIEEAIALGKLPLTPTNSHPVDWVKRDGSAEGFTQEHYALSHFKYEPEIYQQMRGQTTAANNQRQDEQKPICVYDFFNKILSFLKSDDSQLLAIAIAALTGRRHTEVVAKGQFELTAHPYLLHFAGQQKKKQPVSFDILTLIPAAELLPHIHRFRALPDIKPLAGLGHDDPRIDAFNTDLNRVVKREFQDTGLIPVLSGMKTVSIHRFRAIYGAIAIHFFCPPHQGEHRFLQQYLGHILADEAKSAPNSNATTHYWHYYLVDAVGNPLRAKGIKLAEIGTLPDKEAQATAIDIESADGDITGTVQPETPATSELEPISSTVPATAPATAAPNTAAVEAVAPAAKPKAHHKIPADWIKLRDRLLAALPFGTQSPAYKKQRHLFNLLLHSLADAAEISPPAADTQHPTADSDTTPDRQPLTPDTQTPTPAPVTASPQPAADTSALHDAIAQQAKTLAFLSDEVQSLRSLVSQLQSDRDRLAEQTEQLPQLQTELTQLRADNARLQHDSAKLQAFRQLLDSGISEAPAPTTAPVPTAAPIPASPASPSPAPQKSRPAASNSDRTATNSTAAAHSIGAVARAANIFSQVQEWNRSHPDNTFAVNVSLLERGFGIHRQAAKQFMSENETAIANHYDSIGVTNPNYHNRGKDLAELKAFVSGGSV